RARTGAVPPPEHEIVRHVGPLSALATPWDALNDRDHPGAPFRSHPWTAAWWNRFSLAGEPAVLVARERGEVVGILPLYLGPLRLGGRRARIMADRFVGSDYAGLICRGADASRLAPRFARALRTLGASELLFDDLYDDDALARAIVAERAPARIE